VTEVNLLIKLGIIGLGGIAQVMHLPYLTGVEGGGIPGIEVQAISDINGALAKAVGKRYHIQRVFSDYKNMLKSCDLDAIAVLTGGATHAPICIDALNSGMHVFVEKPMCFSSKDAERMIDAAKGNDVILQIGYMKNCDPGHTIACEQFSRMTDIFHIDIHKYYPVLMGPTALQAHQILR